MEAVRLFPSNLTGLLFFMTTKLTGIRTDEVSLVGKGANRKRFLLTKSKEGTMDDLIKELLEEVKALEGEEGMVAEFKKAEMSDSEIATAQAALRLLSKVADKFKKSGVMLKAFEKEPQKAEVTAETAGEFLKAAKPEQRPAIAKAAGLEPDRFALAFEKDKSKDHPLLKADGTLDIDQVPEALRPAMTLLFKESSDTKVKLEKAEEEIRKAKEEKSKQVWLEKAAEFKDLPNTNVEELATTLRKLDDADHDSAEKLLKQLRANKEAIEKGELFKEKGRNGDGIIAGSAVEKVTQMANSLVQKNDKMTEAEAIAKILNDNPLLYKEYTKETEVRA